MRAHKVADRVARDFISKYLDKIVEAYRPRHMILFGSRSADRARADSDVDLLIVADSFRQIEFPDRMGHFLNTIEPDLVVDVICYTPEEFEKVRDGVGMIPDICREGVWLF